MILQRRDTFSIKYKEKTSNVFPRIMNSVTKGKENVPLSAAYKKTNSYSQENQFGSIKKLKSPKKENI